jgi:hypothetical protein
MHGKARSVSVALIAACWAAAPVASVASVAFAGETLPNMQTITPTAARGSTFAPLNPHLAGNPGFVAGQAVSTVV